MIPARVRRRAGVLALIPLALTGAGGTPAPVAEAPGFCTAPAADYYNITLVTTASVPGTRRSSGGADVSFVRSPFGVTLEADGSYRYALDVTTHRLPPAPAGREYAVWVAMNTLAEAERLGTLDASGRASGTVAWNKFLVIVTLEEAGSTGERWQGPVVLRGISRSGLMHTMAGHGPFQQENCAAYGY
ncbi:MAG: hypothetical protein R3E98_04140 [Gemmatimonadota bacterium]|nr:hypothetical protein [Gemmatimonadota bacterium]